MRWFCLWDTGLARSHKSFLVTGCFGRFLMCGTEQPGVHTGYVVVDGFRIYFQVFLLLGLSRDFFHPVLVGGGKRLLCVVAPPTPAFSHHVHRWHWSGGVNKAIVIVPLG